LVEAFNKHDLALLDEFIAPDCVNHTRQLRGLEQVKQYTNTIFRGSSDLQVTIEDIIAEGDKVWLHFKVTGTHTGEWNLFGVPLAPTGKKIAYTGVGIWRIVDGKVVERKSIRDMLDLFREIGIIEPTEKAKKLFPEDVS